MGIALGAWTPPGSKPWTGSTAQHYATTFGHKAAIIHFYQDLVNYGTAFRSSAMDEIAAAGAVPLVSWELSDSTGGPGQPAYANAAFVRGDHDAQLVAWLQQAAAWGKPFLLRFGWEMNGGDYPWSPPHCGNTPGSYIDFWRHVANLVYRHCPPARNLWCPSIDLPAWKQMPLEDLWPGERWVDDAGLDGYNKASAGNPGGVWLAFDQVFRASYDRLLSLMTRPRRIFIAETGCHAAGGDRAAWIADMGRTLATMPAVAALAWWNNASPPLDCRLDGDAATLAAWKALAADPLMQGVLP